MKDLLKILHVITCVSTTKMTFCNAIRAYFCISWLLKNIFVSFELLSYVIFVLFKMRSYELYDTH